MTIIHTFGYASRGIDMQVLLCYYKNMEKKTITRKEFEKIKDQYEAAVRARATVVYDLKKSGKSYAWIAGYFGISRQAAQQIYKGYTVGQ